MANHRQPDLSDLTARIIELAGGRNALAEQLQVISASAIRQWVRVPAQHARRVAEITGLALHEVRPDLWPEPHVPCVKSTSTVG